jgi:hypothetical protein
VVLSFQIDTLGREGAVHEHVKLIEDATELGTCWIVGTVKPYLRGFTSPRHLDFGRLRLGQQHAQKVTVELVMSDDCPEPQSIEVDWKHQAKLVNLDVTFEPPSHASKTIDGSIKRIATFTANITVTGNQVGEVDISRIRLVVKGQSADILGVTNLFMTGSVGSSLTCEPASIYCGGVSSPHSEAISVVITSSAPMSRQPSIIPSCRWIRISEVKHTDQGASFVANLTYPVGEGMFCEAIRVDWGEVIEIPIAGLGRQH